MEGMGGVSVGEGIVKLWKAKRLWELAVKLRKAKRLWYLDGFGTQCKGAGLPRTQRGGGGRVGSGWLGSAI